MADTKKRWFLFDTSNDDNQFGPIVVALIVTLVVALVAVIGTHGHIG